MQPWAPEERQARRRAHIDAPHVITKEFKDLNREDMDIFQADSLNQNVSFLWEAMCGLH